MERKIGEIFEYNGEWYQCVESDNCDRCLLSTTECGSGTKSDLAVEVFGNCSKLRRSDNNHVIFMKLEKFGEPYPNADKLYQLYRLPMNIEKLLPHTEGINLVRWDIVEIEIKQNKENMEKMKIKIDDIVDRYYRNVITFQQFEEELKALYVDKEESKPTLKEFDLEAAKAGKPVCTRDGRKARIICFDSIGGRPIVALVTECDDEEEIPYKYHCDSSYNCQSIPSDIDLMMLSEKREGWVNVYHNTEDRYAAKFGNNVVYKTEDKAKEMGKGCAGYIKTVKINWVD